MDRRERAPPPPKNSGFFLGPNPPPLLKGRPLLEKTLGPLGRHWHGGKVTIFKPTFSSSIPTNPTFFFLKVYVIGVAVVAANVMWRKEDLDHEQNVYGENVFRERAPLPLSPIGLGPKRFWGFFKKNVELGARVCIMLDIVSWH